LIGRLQERFLKVSYDIGLQKVAKLIISHIRWVVRVVFNSSQVLRGYSLNSSFDLGPDIISNLLGVPLRFRKDLVGGQRDMSKMFYMVRINKEDKMMQLFIY